MNLKALATCEADTHGDDVDKIFHVIPISGVWIDDYGEIFNVL